MALTLSAHYDTPHGVACAMLLPIAMEFNTESAADAAIEAVRKLSFDVGIPATCEGLTQADLDQLASERCPMSASRETPVTRAMRK